MYLFFCYLHWLKYQNNYLLMIDFGTLLKEFVDFTSSKDKKYNFYRIFNLYLSCILLLDDIFNVSFWLIIMIKYAYFKV